MSQLLQIIHCQGHSNGLDYIWQTHIDPSSDTINRYENLANLELDFDEL